MKNTVYFILSGKWLWSSACWHLAVLCWLYCTTPFNARFITVDMASCRMAELLVMVPLVNTRSSLMFGWKALPLLRLTYQGCRDPAQVYWNYNLDPPPETYRQACELRKPCKVGSFSTSCPAHSVSAAQHHSPSCCKKEYNGSNWSFVEISTWPAAEWLNHRSPWSSLTSEFQTGSGSGCKTWEFNTAQKHRIVNCDTVFMRNDRCIYIPFCIV